MEDLHLDIKWKHNKISEHYKEMFVGLTVSIIKSFKKKLQRHNELHKNTTILTKQRNKYEKTSNNITRATSNL